MAEFSSDKLYHAGDVIVDEIRIVSYTGFEINIKSMTTDFSIYEDIYSNYLSGSIVFSDSQNLVKNTPIIGNEDIYITFYTPGVDVLPRTVRFKIFKISTFVRGVAPNAIGVRLEFVSHIAEISTRFKLNRVMRNMSYSEMVESVYSDMVRVDPNLPSLISDKTFGHSTAIITNWSPLYSINWFAHRSVSEQNPSIADYLFYQNLDAVNFVPLSKLKQAPVVCTYKSAPGGFRSQSGERMIESELRNITSYAIKDLGDKLKETNLGVYASSMLVHEVTTKSYYGNVYSYKSEFKETPHLNDGRMISFDDPVQDRYLSHMKYYPKSYFQYEYLDDTSFIDRSQNRQSLLNQMNALTMVIDVYGDSTLRVGNIVNLEFFSQEYTKDKTDFLDAYLSGKYMITSILHNVTGVNTSGLHTMRVTISRDSYYEYLPDKKEKDLK